MHIKSNAPLDLSIFTATIKPINVGIILYKVINPFFAPTANASNTGILFISPAVTITAINPGTIISKEPLPYFLMLNNIANINATANATIELTHTAGNISNGV